MRVSHLETSMVPFDSMLAQQFLGEYKKLIGVFVWTLPKDRDPAPVPGATLCTHTHMHTCAHTHRHTLTHSMLLAQECTEYSASKKNELTPGVPAAGILFSLPGHILYFCYQA